MTDTQDSDGAIWMTESCVLCIKKHGNLFMEKCWSACTNLITSSIAEGASILYLVFHGYLEELVRPAFS